jgi:hypothetical protein
VGSSGNLKNHKYGRLIDSKRVVIRINNPPMKGYEKFVGHRPADILMINNHLREGKCYQPKHHEILYVAAPSNGIRNGTTTVSICKMHQKAKILRLSSYITQVAVDLLGLYAERYNSICWSADVFTCLDLECKELRRFIIIAITLSFDLHIMRWTWR